MYRIYSFEKLNVWQRTRELIKEIYLITNKFPADERYGMTSQLKRAVCSISNNLAEGAARKSGKEQARFTEIAYGSLMEVLNQLISSADIGYINEETVIRLRPLIDEIANKLNKLHQSQLNKDKR